MTSLAELYDFFCKRAACRPNTEFKRDLEAGKKDEFDLSENYVGAKGLAPVLEVARNNAQLVGLNLSKNWLEELQVAKVVEMAARHPSLRQINLSNNPIHESSFKPLAYLLATNRNITCLDMQQTSMPAVYANRLAAAVKKNGNTPFDCSRLKTRLSAHAYMSEPADPCSVCVEGRWDAATAGGCVHFASWRKNKQYLMWPSRDGEVRVAIKQPPTADTEQRMGVVVLRRTEKTHRSVLTFHPSDIIAESAFKEARSSVTFAAEKRVKGTDPPYTLIPTTFAPGKTGDFVLTVEEFRSDLSSNDNESTLFTVECVAPETDWVRLPTIRGEWLEGKPGDFVSWRLNPQYLMKLKAGSPVASSKCFCLLTTSVDPDQADAREIGMYVSRGLSEPLRLLAMQDEKVAASTALRRASSVELSFEIPRTEEGYVFIPSTTTPADAGCFELSIFSEADIDVVLLPPTTADAASTKGFPTWQEEVRNGVWDDVLNGGCREQNSVAWQHNPSFSLTLTRDSDVLAVLQADTSSPIALAVYDNVDGYNTVKHASSAKGECAVWLPELSQHVSDYVIVPSTVESGVVARFQLRVYSTKRVHVDQGQPMSARISARDAERYKRENQAAMRERTLSFKDCDFKESAQGFKGCVAERDVIVETYLRSGVMHLDKGFPPSLTSVWKDPGTRNKDYPICHWRRGQDYYPASRLFKPCDTPPGRVCVGMIESHWFLGAAAVVAAHPALLQYLFLSAYPEYGFYQLRFFKYGSWVGVTVDDSFPVDSTNALLFASSPDPGELWPAVLEKAYAKLHKSYEALEISGDPAHALADLTGGLVETVSLVGDEAKERFKQGVTWAQLEASMRNMWPVGLMLDSNKGARIEEKRSMGIPPDHLFPLLEARDVLGKRLLRFRDAWNLDCWKGKWSAGSAQWSADVKQALDYTEGVKDGTFWMAWEEVGYYFTTMYICRLHGKECARPDNWYRASAYSSWEKGKSDGGNALSGGDLWIGNDQFAVVFDDEDIECDTIPLWIQVERSDARGDVLKTISSDGDKLLYPFAIGFHLIASDSNERKLVSLTPEEELRSSAFVQERSIGKEYRVSPAERRYTIVPCMERPGMIGEFLLTIAAPRGVRLAKIDANCNVVIASEWKGASRGGAAGVFGTWRDNPMFLLTPSESTELTVVLKQFNDTASTAAKIGLVVLDAPGVRRPLHMDDNAIVAQAPHTNSDKVVAKLCVQGIKQRAGIPYIIIPSTLYPGQASQFEIEVISNKRMNISKIDPLIDYTSSVISGSWSLAAGTAGGFLTHTTWRDNTQYLLQFRDQSAKLLLVLSKRLGDCVENDSSEIGLVVFRASNFEGGNRKKVAYSPDEIVAQTNMALTRTSNHIEIDLTLPVNGKNHYLVMPCTRCPYVEGGFTLEMYTDSDATLTELPTQRRWCSEVLDGEWKPGHSAGGAREKHRTWGCNPHYRLTVPRPTSIVAVLSQIPLQPGQVSFASARLRGVGKHRPPTIVDPANNVCIGIDLCNDDEDLTHITRTRFTSSTDVTLTSTIAKGSFILVPHTFESELECHFTLCLYSDVPLEIVPVKRDKKYF
ncbi:Calpain-type cysteine protease ADL1 [Diplonema papillatum]|nr:Calpain-type cysteine protease ADL1 [Diplonema papillatum]